MQAVLDARLQHWLKRKISNLPIDQQIQLKNIKLCGSKTIPEKMGAAVFVLRNKNRQDSTLFGQLTCKNPWACPHCSAVRMNHYAKEIAAALDALKSTHFGFMTTFTIPHLKFQSCRQVTDILYKTWRKFTLNSTSNRKTTDGKIRWSSPFHKFRAENEIKHHVRAAEYTYGNNGWHPHFHVIFWTPRKYKDRILSYENSIKNFWIKCFCSVIKEYNFDEITEKYFINQINIEYGSKSLYISKNGQEIAESTSSEYLCGWGTDKELTGNRQKKASHNNHLTPYQILELATNGDQEMADLYIEFALQVTRKPVKHRVDFSQSGLKKIIKDYINTEGYKSVINKKKADEWEVVCWFTSQQWCELCAENYNSPIISNILYLAAINRRDLLVGFLESFNIKLAKCAHFESLANHVENIFNAA